MSTVVKDLGAVSAYAYAVEKGYTGTEEEFAELMAAYADVGQTAVDAKDAAVAAKTAAETAAGTATTKASEATTAAQTATTKAGEASQSASQANTSAQTATTKASEASTAASTATEKATEATTAAGTATTAKNDAVAAKTAAETAQGKAETAQGAAEDAAESVSASAAQIATNTADITELKEDKVSKVDFYGAFPTDSASGAVASFSDGADNIPMESVKVAIDPVQDLHGQANPYPAGGGKNLLEVTATSQTLNGVTFTVHDDGTVTANGTATANTFFELITSNISFTESTILNGCPSGGGGTTYAIQLNGSSLEVGSGITIAANTTITSVRIRIASGATLNNVVFKPMIRLATVSDSTFAPYSNICPISGWSEVNVEKCGKNLFDAEGIVESSGHPDQCYIYDGYLLYYTGSSTVNGINWLGLKIHCPCVFHGTIKNFSTAGINTIRFKFSFDDGTYESPTLVSELAAEASSDFSVTIGTPGKTLVAIQNAWNDARPAGFLLSNTQLELGTIATPYEPYQSTPLTISLGQTVYGGTLDVVSGELVVDRAMADLGTLEWNKNHYRLNSDSVLRIVKKPTANDIKANIVCEAYGTITADETYLKHNGIGITRTGTIFVYDPTYEADETVTNFVASVQGKKFVYELAEPLVYQLTPTEVKSLLGQNHLWADTGDVEVEYRADTRLYIEKLTAPTEDDMIADHAISAGTFFMIGNALYLATSQIAAGGTITPGTNAQRVSLADALNLVNA